jgi:3-phenylpropionate/trans-cinnamate dioxygenase ferredoxin subunit
MADFIQVASLDRSPIGSSSVFTIASKCLALFNVAGTIHAIDDTCPHAGGSLGTSRLDGTIVTCRAHGMKFDVTTGCFAGGTGFGVASYPVKVVDGKIMVAIGATEKT